MTDLNNYNTESRGGLVVLLCDRQHDEPGVWAGIIARDMDGDQSGLTLAELVEHAQSHESEAHGGTA